MCFSATASFTVSTLLISTGIFSVITAFKHNKDYLLLSYIPIIFGLQQGIEGIIWWRLHHSYVSLADFYGYSYLFFAFCFWPFYVPICVYYIEKEVIRKKMITGLMLLGLLLGLIMFLPILFGIIPLTTTIRGHSIYYRTYLWEPLIWTYAVCYALSVIMPLFISSVSRMTVFGCMLLAALILSYWQYVYAFTSIWCFFAAILSAYIAYITHWTKT